MSDSHDEVERLRSRIDGLEQRLSLLEQVLGDGRRPVPFMKAAEGVRTAESWAPVPGLDGLHSAEMSRPPAALIHPEATSAPDTWSSPLPPPIPSGMPHGHSAPPPIPQVTRRPGAGLEVAIGKNWTSWIGAVVIVLGVVFFLKYAWDAGWLRMSPAGRVVVSLLAGAAMLAAGQILHRRQMRILAATVSGGGVAVAMAALFAAHVMFDPPVLLRSTAFACVVAATGVGILVSLQINALTVTIIALLGAYIAPAVLGGRHDQSLSLMLYLGSLAVAGWTLSYLKPRWWGLRWFLWVCTTLWMLTWLLTAGLRPQHRMLAIISTAVFFAGFIGEAFASLHRAFRIRDPDNESLTPKFARRLDASLATLSMLTTAAAFGAFYTLLDRDAPAGLLQLHPTTAVALGLACLHGVLAFATPAPQFMRSSLLQAAALITLAIPLALGQFAVTLSWLVLAVALAALGWRTSNRPVRIWSVVLLALATLRLQTLDAFNSSLKSVVFEVAGQPVTRWLLLAWGTAVLYHVTAALCTWRWPVQSEMNRAGERVGADAPRYSMWGIVLAATGTLLFVCATIGHWSGPYFSFATILWCGTILILGPWAVPMAYLEHGMIALALVLLNWIMQDQFWAALDNWYSPALFASPLFNLSALNGLLLAGLFAISAGRTSGQIRSLNILASAVAGFALLNFETLRVMNALAARFADVATAKQVALSVLWAAIGLAGVLVGFARGLAGLRYAALALLGVTLLKIFLVDMAHVRPVYRILSFMAVGVLLLCVSFVYHKQSLSRRDPDLPPP